MGSHKFYSNFLNIGTRLSNNLNKESRKKLLLLPQGTFNEVKEICELAFLMNFDQFEIILRLPSLN